MAQIKVIQLSDTFKQYAIINGTGDQTHGLITINCMSSDPADLSVLSSILLAVDPDLTEVELSMLTGDSMVRTG